MKIKRLSEDSPWNFNQVAFDSVWFIHPTDLLVVSKRLIFARLVYIGPSLQCQCFLTVLKIHGNLLLQTHGRNSLVLRKTNKTIILSHEDLKEVRGGQWCQLNLWKHPKEPSIHYVSKRTGWMSSENGNVYLEILYSCWHTEGGGGVQKSPKIYWRNIWCPLKNRTDVKR